MTKSPDKKQKNDILRKALAKEVLLQTLLEAAPNAFIIVASGGQIIYANKAAIEMFGYNDEEISRQNINILVPERFKEKHDQHCSQFFENPESRPMGSIELDLIGLHKDKKEFPLDSALIPIKIEGELAVVTIIRDLTKRKQTEKALEESNKKLQETLEGTINVISTIAEKRDPYTAGHQRRVSKLAHAIAREMELEPNRAEGVRIGALIHDIGKIAIPIEILSKPGKLKKDELNIIKTHSALGFEITKDVKFSWPIAKMILQIHERLDGSGYPNGVREQQIILEARISAVADVVEAMASHRPYRPALGVDAALTELLINKGKLYDPKAVDACVNLFKEKGFSLNS